MPIALISFILVIILMSFVFGGLAIKWHNDFTLRRDRLRAELQGSSMGTSELKELVQAAMLEAVAPLEERLELIEKHMRQLPEHASKPGAPDEAGQDDATRGQTE